MLDKQKIHTRTVTAIATQVADFYTRKQPFHIYHGSTNSTRILTFKRSEMIDTSHLNNVLSISPETSTAVIEPNVPMDKLVTATRTYGLIPPVVMEFPGITVGGGIQGGAGESSSFKWGCFNQTFNWYDIILADGTTVRASPTEHADLFYGCAGSFGTLGIITAAEIQLIPAKRYVNLTYVPIASFDAAVQTLAQTTTASYDYIDGIMFGADHGLIMLGTLSDTPQGDVRRFTRAHDSWFYLHAEAIDHNRRQLTEAIPLNDYLFRYDRGAFWVGKFAYDIFNVPFNKLTRWLLNPYMHTRTLYKALQDSGVSQQHVVQDLALPQHNSVKFMQFVDQHLQVYPMWLCPLKPDTHSPLQSNNLQTPLVINVGVWGQHMASYEQFVDANRAIEHKLIELGGKKSFYAHSYYTETEFWQLYDKGRYTALRTTYHASSLPTIYDKVTVKKRFPLTLKRGAYRTLFGRAKIRIKD